MPIRALLTTTALTAALAAAVVVPTASAHAATDRARDAAGDVRSRGLFVDAPPRRPEPDRRVGDIVRHRTAYGTELVVTTKFRSLAAVGDQDFSWFVLTSEDEFEWYASLVVPAGKDKGQFTLIDPIANQPGCGRAVLDRPGRTVTLRIPASCLGDPEWVRVGHGVRVYTDEREYADDARRDGVRGVGAWKYGPKVTR